MNPVILIGGFIETIELCERCGYKVVGIVDSNHCPEYDNYFYIGTDEHLFREKEKYIEIPVVITPDSPKIRRNLFALYKQNGFQIETVISPRANIAPSAIIGAGSIIQDNCNISSKVILEEGVHINSCANIMHETTVGKYSTIAPNAVVLGRCRIDSDTYIGANSTILPNRIIGEKSTVGAAAVVTKDIAKNVVAVGIPARVQKGKN